jgi:hypothetical protein
MHPAKAERLRKEKSPERFCPHPNCLWRASSGLCPKHQAAAVEGPTPENTPQDAADYSSYNGDNGVRGTARLADEWPDDVVPDLSRFPSEDDDRSILRFGGYE